MNGIEMLAAVFGIVIVFTTFLFVFSAFIGQRMGEAQRQRKYYVEFSNGRYVLQKKKPQPRYIGFET
jgi:ABC-type transporter Mla subunit MlaD